MWGLAVVVHLVCYVIAANAQAPTDEVYTQLLSFQVAAFALMRFPYWIGAILMVLVMEFAVFGRTERNDDA